MFAKSNKSWIYNFMFDQRNKAVAIKFMGDVSNKAIKCHLKGNIQRIGVFWQCLPVCVCVEWDDFSSSTHRRQTSWTNQKNVKLDKDLKPFQKLVDDSWDTVVWLWTTVLTGGWVERG